MAKCTLTQPCRALWCFGGAGAGSAAANQRFEEGLCSLSLFPSSFLLCVWAVSLPVTQAAVGQEGNFVGKVDIGKRLSFLAAWFEVAKHLGPCEH